MSTKMFQCLFAVLICTLAYPIQLTAQSTEFSEFTRGFFSQPKTYSVEGYGLSILGPEGLTSYKPGQASLSVTSTGFSYKYGDGSGATHKITSSLKNVTVLTSRGDVTMQMYILDNGNAVRAIKFKDGHCAVHRYVLNNASGKYVHNDWFTLRK